MISSHHISAQLGRQRQADLVRAGHAVARAPESEPRTGPDLDPRFPRRWVAPIARLVPVPLRRGRGYGECAGRPKSTL